MESNGTLNKLKNEIKQLKKFQSSFEGLIEEKYSELLKKESTLLTKIVNCIHEILSDNFNIQKVHNQENQEMIDNDNYYWNFISKHFNTPVVYFCRAFDKKENNSGNIFLQKGKNWIYFSILENSLYDSINEIYNQKLDEIYYEKNSLLIKYKSEIKNLLKELNEIILANINSKDFEKYLEFKKKNQKRKPYEELNFENDLNFIPSPIISKRKLNFRPQGSNSDFFSSFNLGLINCQSEIINPEENDFIDENLPLILEHPKTEEDNVRDLKVEKFADFSPSIVENFYTFIQKKEEKIEEQENNEDQKNLFIINSFIEEETNLNNNNEKKKKYNLRLNLNRHIIVKNLPTDKLYEIDEKFFLKKYNKNDNLIIYKGKKRKISNCLLLYLNKYYKKAIYYKFNKQNLNKRPINLREQNFQCYICLKKFEHFYGLPKDQVFWCSYYMRYVCKNCIDDKISIIPSLVIKKWCFDKFSISKRAKHTLDQWYDKPIIIFKKDDKLLEKNQHLNKVIKIKKNINNIIDKMKCEDKFTFIEETFGGYDYLATKENIFSLKDLVEINNKSFLRKINKFQEKFINHISTECYKCKFEGEKCNKCGFEKKIFFYNTDEVFYCKKCQKSYHKKCIGIIGHFH